MSKLDGNTRWQSKMLLPEHQAQYEQRHERNSNRPTKEEFAMVRDVVLLPHMLTMVEEGIEKIKHSTGFMSRLYLAAAFALHDSISRDLKRLKLELRRRNMKVVQNEQTDLVMYHQIFCRGYEEKFGLVRDVMRSEIKIRMTQYIRELEARLKQ